jgi:NADP oxidoreductase coenzyme F420-dependent
MDIDQGGRSAQRIALLGGGRMGFALLKGWLARGVPGASVRVVEPSPSPQLVELVSTSGSSIVGISEALAADVLVLAVKPQLIADTATQARALLAPRASSCQSWPAQRLRNSAGSFRGQHPSFARCQISQHQ